MKRKKKLVVSAVICAVILCVVAVAAVIIYNIPPVLNIIGEEKSTVEVLSKYNDPGAQLCAKTGRVISVPCITEGTVNTSVIGTYNITYTYDFHGKSYTGSRTVNVTDTTPPVLTLSGDEVCTYESINAYVEAGYTATDLYDGDITSSVSVTTAELDGEYLFTYTVSDLSGNTSTASRTVKIADLAAPAVIINGSKTVTLLQGEAYVESGARAIDSYEGDLTSRIVVSGAVNTAALGTYNITYSVSDSSGYSSYAVRTVRVVSPEEAAPSPVYLTFDDGPSVSVTTRILDILAANNVKATFFLVNFDTPEKEALVRRMAAEGHTIGIHGYSHNYDTIYASEEAFMSNIYTLRDKIALTTGVTTNIIRFPGGSSNKVSSFNPGIMTRLTVRVRDEGFTYYDWNVSSGDAEIGNPSAEKILSNVKKGLKPGRRNIVLMHDSSAKGTTADALQGVIDYCVQNGYSIFPISDSTPAVTHNIYN